MERINSILPAFYISQIVSAQCHGTLWWLWQITRELHQVVFVIVSFNKRLCP